MQAVPDQVTRWVPTRFVTLGCDGFGRSDTRRRLRRFFEIDTGYLVVNLLSALAAQGSLSPSVVSQAMKRYWIDPESGPPWKN